MMMMKILGRDLSNLFPTNRWCIRIEGARRRPGAREIEEFIEKARARKRGVVVGAGHEFGAFEKHTTGFGSRMLAKMGFKGRFWFRFWKNGGHRRPDCARREAKRRSLERSVPKDSSLVYDCISKIF